MYSVCSMKLKLGTISQIVEALLEQGENEAANEAAIILKTAVICEDSGIEAAMKYYNGAHSTDEYVEFMIGVAAPVGRVSEKTRYTGRGKEEE